MIGWQKYFLFAFAIYSLLAAVVGYTRSKKNKNPFGYSHLFVPLGAFVWADAFILGIFWFLASTFVIIRGDWILFLLITSVFWTVRSFGEVVYWLNQQFSGVNRNPPERLLLYSIFKNDSIWFVYQLVWQCLAVVSIVFTIYFTYLWI